MTHLSALLLFACTTGKISAGEDSQDESSGPSTSSESTPSEPASEPGDSEEESDAPQEEHTEDEPPAESLDTGSPAGETDAPTDAEGLESEEDVSEDDSDISVEDYVTTYCSTYAVPCSGYPNVPDCVDFMMAVHFEGCEVVDMDALVECDRWVSGITCDETSWLPACDEFIACD